MAREHPSVAFERYADDIIVHCRSMAEATYIRRQIEQRLQACKLEVNLDKTRIVYPIVA
jgi:RNA-directed DNA polymerase